MFPIDILSNIMDYCYNPNYYILNKDIYNYIKLEEDNEYWKQKYNYLLKNFVLKSHYKNLINNYNWKRKYIFINNKKNQLIELINTRNAHNNHDKILIELSNLINKSIEDDCNLSEILSQIIFELYKYKYRCISVHNTNIYKFKNSIWIKADTYKSIDKFIYVLNKIYKNLIVDYSTKRLSDKFSVKNLIMIINKLELYTFKNTIKQHILDELYKYSINFIKMLDDKPNIIGFDNGVFDLDKGCFRKSKVDDYVSKSCGYMYKNYNKDDQIIKNIDQYLDNIFGDVNTKNYICKYLASCLSGYNLRYIEIMFWIYEDINIEENILEFVKNIFGEYFGTLSSNIFKRKYCFASPELIGANSKKILCSVLCDNEVIDINKVKHLMEPSKMHVRPLYNEPWYYNKSNPKIIILCKICQICLQI